ncbi:V-type ATP synthase subunit E [Clostridium rectalis]|uniref:V-type ATP synthase subunit E n=1 Tax=Clostridium rectalis TaxID=2040295 RepID=UPI000F644DF6|nr:V-type ATP synthase subunit E family protein [Clostridium rectalis]
MTNLDKLTAKIINDAENKKKTILQEARDEEKKIINEKIKEGNLKKDVAIEKSHIEAQYKKERIISNAHLYVRNRKLQVKQQIIDKVYVTALDKLSTLPKDEYIAFIENSILSMNINGDEEVILSNKEKIINEDILNSINYKLINKGKKGNLVISEDRREFEGGFILYKDGIEINNTFEALLGSLKDDLEQNIINCIFS